MCGGWAAILLSLSLPLTVCLLSVSLLLWAGTKGCARLTNNMMRYDICANNFCAELDIIENHTDPHRLYIKT